MNGNSSTTKEGAKKEKPMLMLILIVVVVLACVGTVPAWPHSNNWGYGPSGILGVVLVVVLIFYLMGHRF